MVTTPIINMSKGEFGPALYGRIDVPQYAAGMKTAKNVVLLRQGGVASRGGLRLVGEADSHEDADIERMFPFQFNDEQAYILAARQANMRLLAFGGFVIEDDLEIKSFTKTDPMSVEVPFHDFSVGDRVYFDGNEGVPELAGRFTEVLSVTDVDNFTVDIDATGFADLVSSTGITRTGAPAPVDPVDPPTDPVDPPTPPNTGGGSVSDVDLGGTPYDPDSELP